MSPRTAIFDVDGTLVDTNYHHAVAWFRAFRQFDLVLPLWELHRHIGMGGDQLVSALAGESWEAEHGEAVRAAEGVLYLELIEEVRPLPGAEDLLDELGRRGHRIVLASSAKDREIEHYLDLLDARGRVHAWTTADDVENTKPEPDLIRAAIDKAEDPDSVMFGDSSWDHEAAARAGIPSVGVMTGGFSPEELREAGAVAVFRSLPELTERLSETPLEGR